MNANKKIVAEEAVKEIKDGMTVGLGSGSTVYWMLQALGERVKNGLEIVGVPTSQKTEKLAKELGIPLADFSSVDGIDLAIDGADEVDPHLHLLKGGGGSLVREKIVDILAKRLIIIVDETKVVDYLGTFSLPVEVVPFGWETTRDRVAQLGCLPTIRKQDGEVFVSDNDNYILDCDFESIQEPAELHEQLKGLVGVVETGLFINMADVVMIGHAGMVDVLTKS
ncbi:ribose-5-phosphate isomerase RpiA [Oceanobacillus manasiensis]|uniref:ribose-5-phosphate isomerase RpiA n=1 Tax=Oceanobacillus manasiensis TaxID=586413 RepID=UPI0005A83716|nr:ribose-5-phosphate isomerase RpiA [Oceanobacillus manasiensis]